MNLNNKAKRAAATIIVLLLIITSEIYVLKNSSKSGITTAEASSSVKSADYEGLFKKDSVVDIKINVSEEDWKSMMDNPTAEEYKSASVTINGTTIDNVGFRTKGNSTLKQVAQSDSDRFSFRVKLDKYVDAQKYMGLDEIALNNEYSDPSYMREYLSYEALRAIGAKVPETVFANVYINDKLYGFYLCIETVDDSFLNRNFGNNDGNLYRQDQGSTLQYKEGSNYDSSEQKQGKDESKTDLKNLIKTLNDMPQGQKGNIESVLDVDSALKYIAANTVLGSYDSYSGNFTQNYYLYGQDGKFTVIPWDYNMSFGGFGMGGDATTIPIDEPVMGVNIKNLPMINNLLSVDDYKTKYHQYIEELLKYLDGFESRVTEVANVIRPYVKADPTKFYTMEQFEANIIYDETKKASTAANTGTQNSASANGTASKPDTNTGASVPENQNQQLPGNIQGQPRQLPDNIQGQMPQMQDNAKGQKQRQLPNNANGQQPGQGGFPNGNLQAPQQFGNDGQFKGGRGGGMGMGASTSIINFVRDRVDNIKKQLSGELPTTGNTTMNNSNMRGMPQTNKQN